MSVLSIRGLGKRYGAVEALADLDLDVAEASRTAVVGASGSGKTTLLRLIAGFEAPDAGEVKLDGRLVADKTTGVPPHLRNVGLVMQEGALFPHMSVLENIRFGIRDRKDGHAECMRLMELVELDRRMASRAPHELSGGQQQRVALARALARQPRVMLLDEPFSALDTGLREQMRKATADILTNAGVATVLVTHDREESMAFADQLVVLSEGRLAQAGHPRELYLSPANEAVATFLGPVILLDAELADGLARTAIGDLTLADGKGRTGKGQVMLRHEQLRLIRAHNPASTAWRLRKVDTVASRARVTIDGPNAFSLDFETTAIDLPLAGTPVALRVIGDAHLLPR